MNILAYILSLFQKKHFTGLIPDPRSPEEKSLDFLHEEVAAAPVPVYKMGKSNLNDYPIEDQNQTYSCVAHGSTLAMTKGNPRLSKMFFYRKRQNYPDPGMWLQGAGDIAKKSGSCLYNTLPNASNEYDANSIQLTPNEVIEASGHKVQDYIQIQNLDIDTIASVVTQGTPVAILIYASYRDWSKEYPTMYDPTKLLGAPLRHCVCAVDAFIENGVKYLKIQDSAHFGGISSRYLSEQFIAKRCYGAMYFVTLTTQPVPKPDHKFLVDMRLGDNSNEVAFLQKRLMYEGFFPSTQTATGLFGGITLKAVKSYQSAHGLPSTGFCGVLTRSLLNS